jgi:RNA 3'-terminal phosphate cyclase
MGFEFQLTLDQPGFYPRGGGRITANIRPSRKILPIHLTQRGKLLQITGISAVASLKRSIAERQKRQALLRLQALPIWPAQPKIQIKLLPSPQMHLILLADSVDAMLFSLGGWKTGQELRINRRCSIKFIRTISHPPIFS